MICFEIFGLEHCESTDNKDEKNGEYTRFRNAIYTIDWESFSESFFEHIKCCEENDKESNPLDAWILF
jgi:hypothetical protein